MGDKWKAAFMCYEGAFEPLVMYFGLTNSLSTLQTMMNALSFDMGACVMVYMDNILIYTKTEEGHDEIVLQVLEILQKNDLFVKAEKCKFKVRTKVLRLNYWTQWCIYESEESRWNLEVACTNKGQESPIIP